MFTLKIQLGNAAMQSQEDVSEALRRVSVELAGRGTEDDDGVIMDYNGNRVGEWKFRAEKRLARKRAEE